MLLYTSTSLESFIEVLGIWLLIFASLEIITPSQQNVMNMLTLRIQHYCYIRNNIIDSSSCFTLRVFLHFLCSIEMYSKHVI